MRTTRMALTEHPLPLALALGLLAALVALHNLLDMVALGSLPRVFSGATLVDTPLSDRTLSDTPLSHAPIATTSELLVHYTILPRIAVALLAGAALAAAGAVLQYTLRNPLAEPATLGISSGAHLALTLATLYFPAALSAGLEPAALAGAFVALAAVLGLSWNRNLSPVTVVLSGLIVSLYCGALAAAATLFNHDLLIGLFLWGAGYLDQQDWSGVYFLAPRLLIAAAGLALFARVLALASLEDDTARSLGIPAAAVRLAALVLAAAMIAVVTASVGIIGFVGLAAPSLARALGARRFGQQVLWSGALGGLLLLVTDQVVLALPSTYRIFPTGAVTALLAAPLLLVLIRRVRLLTTQRDGGAHDAARRMARPWRGIAWILLALAGAALLALIVGRDADGWHLLSDAGLARDLPWRWPRALAATAGGAMLALAGGILQRATGNPIASPEVLGVSSGAILGVIALTLVSTVVTRPAQLAAGTAGALLVLLIILVLSRRPGYAGDRLLLVGIALSSVSGFIMAVLMAAQDPRLEQLLTWLSGSTYAVTPGEAVFSACVALLGLLCVPAMFRWLELFGLGRTTAASAGVSMQGSQTALLAHAAILTSAATILVGPLSFAGLMGPHLARLAGFQRSGPHLVASFLLGGLILLVADWAGRMVIFPFQVPAGLLAAIVGGPFLLLLIGRRA